MCSKCRILYNNHIAEGESLSIKHLAFSCVIVYHYIDRRRRSPSNYAPLLQKTEQKEVMTMKKFIACMLISAMVCGAFASCGDKEESSQEPTTEATTEASSEATSEEPSAISAEDIDFEDTVVAQDGDAYLAIVDGQWWIQYWGGDDPSKDYLTYNAGVCPITGNGDYTVSVTADTNGFRFDTTGSPDDQYVPSGLQFMAVMIKNGETACPGAVITVNSVKVDGNELTLDGKPYTSSDDGKETRANLYNQWVSKDNMPKDARTAEGMLYEGEGDAATPASYIGDYSPQAVNPDDFANGWTTVEVNFTISGMAE